MSYIDGFVADFQSAKGGLSPNIVPNSQLLPVVAAPTNANAAAAGVPLYGFYRQSATDPAVIYQRTV